MKFFDYIKEKINEICLTDRCLLIFMIILMAQTTYNLFYPTANITETSAVDVIIRTTSAAIFGYFISGGFLRGSANPKPKNKSQPLEACDNSPTNNPFPDFEHRTKQQIIIVTSIGGFSLLLLIFAQNSGGLSQASIAIASQLRDFISGSVGLLIGHSTRDKL